MEIKITDGKTESYTSKIVIINDATVEVTFKDGKLHSSECKYDNTGKDSSEMKAGIYLYYEDAVGDTIAAIKELWKEEQGVGGNVYERLAKECGLTKFGDDNRYVDKWNQLFRLTRCGFVPQNLKLL